MHSFHISHSKVKQIMKYQGQENTHKEAISVVVENICKMYLIQKGRELGPDWVNSEIFWLQ